MTEQEFNQFICRAVVRDTGHIGKIGHLVLTQTGTKTEAIVREPEMRTAFQLEADAANLFYGIEVPTEHTYCFTGADKRCALIDFAVLESHQNVWLRTVLVELKEGQPGRVKHLEHDTFDYPTITKDIHKLLAEPGGPGRCMFHICRAADSGTLPALIEKYNLISTPCPIQGE